MGGSILNREDYKTAIPQLSSQLNDLLENNVIINRTVVTLSEGKVSDLNNYLGYFQNLATGYFQAIAGDIEYLSSREAYINHLKTDIASFGYLTAETADLRYATISNLNAAVARIGDLEADHVSVSDLTAATGRISDLEADHVSTSDLAATNADVAHLKVGDLTIGGVTVNIYDLAIAIKNSAMASGTTWYKVSASTPTAPAVFDPSADGWSQTEPAYVGGTTDHLYSCLRVVYADDDPLGTRHFQWSDVHMIQSWEAAKSAYTYADNAYDYAEAAGEAAESALINLSQVEDVVGVLNWITEHGTMTLTSDVTVNPAHIYFVVDPAGDYVVGGTHYSIVSDPKDTELPTYYELSVDESIQNYVATHISVDTEGLWLIPNSGGYKVLIATGAGSAYTTAGTYIVGAGNTILASFTASGATVGANADGESRSELSGNGMRILRKSSGSDIEMAFFGYGATSDGTAPYYTFGTRLTEASEHNPTKYYLAGDLCREGGSIYVRNKDGQGSFSYNDWEYYIGRDSYVVGTSGVASKADAYSEGHGCRAIRGNAHAEGYQSRAIGYNSHAEGEETQARGRASHSQNYCTVSGHDYQTAIGKFNDNKPDTAFEIGNGTDNTDLSNAFEVDWSGNVVAGGSVHAAGWAGFVQMFAGATPPTGWLLCDGSEAAVADYPLLYAVIGNTYGTPSDSDHFVLPDFMGRTPIGAGQGTGLSNRTRGQKVGAETHKLTVNEMPSHRHKQVDTPWFQSNRVMSSGAYTLADVRTSNVYTEYTGGDQEHNNMQPSLGINFIICTGETS